ncbi:MAG: response regulator [Desulfatitalea sp.]
MKILYVEDNPADADLAFRELFRSAPDIDIEVVHTLGGAVERLSGLNPAPTYDLVLTDLRLPDGSGMELLHHVRDTGLPLPVVLISASGDEETVVAALKAGADDYMAKNGDYLERLPATLRHAAASYRARAMRRTHPLRVLYAEHHATDIDLTQRHLARHAPHIQLESVRSAEALFERLRAAKPDHFQVVLLDYHLPDAIGLETLKALRDRYAPDVPVILVTGWGGETLVLQALKLGASDYLVKHPDYLYQLPGTIENAYHHWQLLHEQAALIASQAALQQSETRYRSLFQEYHQLLDAMPDCLTLHTADQHIAWANQEASRFLSLSTEGIVGQPCCQLWHGRETPLAICPVAHSFQTGEAVHFTDYPAGARRWDVRTVPIQGENGTVERVIRVARDVTETRLLEQQVRQAQKMEAIGTLASGIAHDFNNILAAIIGFAEMTLHYGDLNPQARGNIQEILKAGMRAKELVLQILAFSRRSEQQFLPVRLADIVAEALKLLRPTLPATIAIQTRIDSHSAIEANINQIHQVIMNLCTNAAHAMRQAGGTLTVALADTHVDAQKALTHRDLKQGHYVCLSVQDTGHGMDATTLERIFEPYFTTKRAGEGSGLGLAVVHGIVKNHKGAIMVESRPGAGTLFALYFPTSHEKPLTIEQPSALGDLKGGTERILFVDDEVRLARLGEQMLKRLGYRIDTFESPAAALAAFQTDPDGFDLLITDLTMPQMTGLDLAEACMRIRPELRVIICTGHGILGPEHQQKADHMAISAFVNKPVRLQELAGTIREVLDSTTH